MEYHTRTTITVNAELDILKEIKELCEKERKSLSEKINELFIEELEKKVVGCKNPLNVSYNQQEEKPLQTDLTQWIDAVHYYKDNNVMLSHIEKIGTAVAATARSYLRGNTRPYRI
jgi:hypothetical protein